MPAQLQHSELLLVSSHSTPDLTIEENDRINKTLHARRSMRVCEFIFVLAYKSLARLRALTGCDRYEDLSDGRKYDLGNLPCQGNVRHSQFTIGRVPSTRTRLVDFPLYDRADDHRNCRQHEADAESSSWPDGISELLCQGIKPKGDDRSEYDDTEWIEIACRELPRLLTSHL